MSLNHFVGLWRTKCNIILYIYIYICSIGIMVRVFANGPVDLGSIPGRGMLKTQKMVLDATLLNTQHYKVRIQGKVDQFREKSYALSYTSVSKREPSGHPPQLYLHIYIYIYIYICIYIVIHWQTVSFNHIFSV